MPPLASVAPLDRTLPVAVFDSGVGGLGVLHECLMSLPHEEPAGELHAVASAELAPLIQEGGEVDGRVASWVDALSRPRRKPASIPSSSAERTIRSCGGCFSARSLPGL